MIIGVPAGDLWRETISIKRWNLRVFVRFCIRRLYVFRLSIQIDSAP